MKEEEINYPIKTINKAVLITFKNGQKSYAVIETDSDAEVAVSYLADIKYVNEKEVKNLKHLRYWHYGVNNIDDLNEQEEAIGY